MTYVPGKTPQLKEEEPSALAYFLERELRALAAEVNGKPSPIRNFIDGFQLTWLSNTTISVGPGLASDDQQTTWISSSATITLDFGTNGANGLDAGALANNTFYHVFMIISPLGNYAAFASTSLTPTLPSGYKFKRRVGSVRTDGAAHILSFLHTRDEFLYAVPIQDAAAFAVGATATHTLSLPTGIRVTALFTILFQNSAGAAFGIFFPPDFSQTANTPGGNIDAIVNNSTLQTAKIFRVRTNTLAQVKSSWNPGVSNLLYINTLGWVDDRGRNS